MSKFSCTATVQAQHLLKLLQLPMVLKYGYSTINFSILIAAELCLISQFYEMKATSEMGSISAPTWAPQSVSSFTGSLLKVPLQQQSAFRPTYSIVL